MNIVISPEIRAAAPGLRLAVVTATVPANPDTPQALWELLLAQGEQMRSRYRLEQVNRRPAIAATRAAYKALGKDPNRYRPSSDALTRRLVKGMDLYRISTLVDLINVVSVACGHSIGGFDLDKIQGDTLTLGVGREGEEFHAIHRGELNISHLPVYRDALSGIGTPTSDCERTSLTAATRRVLMIINAYGPGDISLEEAARMTCDLLRSHAKASEVECSFINPCP